MDDGESEADDPLLGCPNGDWDSSQSTTAVTEEFGAHSGIAAIGQNSLGAWRRLRAIPVWCWLLGSMLAVAVLSAPTLLAFAYARAPAERGAAAATRGAMALARGESVTALTEFDRARASFALADRHLRGRLASVGGTLPWVSENVRASRTLVRVGTRLATSGGRLAQASAGEIQAPQGSVPIERISQATPILEDAAGVVMSSQAELATLDGLLVLPAFRHAAADLRARLSTESSRLTRAVETTRLLPAMLGAEGARHYFVAFQNNAEMRGTGGLIGNWGELVAEGGRLQLGRFGRASDLIRSGAQARARDLPEEFLARWQGFHVDQAWQQVNVSPDFPTTARIISDMYTQSGGRLVDGVIAVDVPGLASMLTLTGPVDIATWPVAITAQNLVQITLGEAYERFPERREREAFLEELTRRVWTAFTDGEVGPPGTVARALGNAARDGHLALYMERSEEQRLVSLLGADGAVPKLQSDSIMLVNQNIAPNKLDALLSRRIRYDVRLQPTTDSAKVSGVLQVTLANQAGTSGPPDVVPGPNDEQYQAGENRTYVSLYTPLKAENARLDGDVAIGLDSQGDLGRTAHSTVLRIPPLQSKTLELELTGWVALRGGWYVLDVGRQPSILPTEAEISVAVPRGWRIAEARGLPLSSDRTASGLVPAGRAHSIRLRLEPERSARVTYRILDRVRAVKAFWYSATFLCLVRETTPHYAGC